MGMGTVCAWHELSVACASHLCELEWVRLAYAVTRREHLASLQLVAARAEPTGGLAWVPARQRRRVRGDRAVELLAAASAVLRASAAVAGRLPIHPVESTLVVDACTGRSGDHRVHISAAQAAAPDC